MIMTDDVKLEPCPFCGCKMEYMPGEEDGPYWRHPEMEPQCWLETAWVSRSLEGEGGINEWNRRASPPAESEAFGWIYINPDTGVEWSEQSPIESGEVPDAGALEPATAHALHKLLMQAWDDVRQLERKLASPPAPAVAVKPLEWEEPSSKNNGCWTAQSPLGAYSVVNEGGWHASRDEAPRDFYFEWCGQDMSRDTLHTAQTAAQADYEQRIRSALVDSAPAVAVPEDVEILIEWLEIEAIASRTPDHDRDNFNNAAKLLRLLAAAPQPPATRSYEEGKREGRQEGIEAAAKVGWNACRRSVYAICESMQDEADRLDDGTKDTPQYHFWRGQRSAAKSIARGFNSFEAEDDDNFATAIRSLADEPRHGE